MSSENDYKVLTLAEYLEIDPEDIELTSYGEFDANGREYLVLTDDEATEKATDYIRESVWAFNSSFLQSYLADGALTSDQIDALRGDSCEDINDAFLAMIGDSDDFESFADDAISCDGRGHFISSYDGEEHESSDYFIYRTD